MQGAGPSIQGTHNLVRQKHVNKLRCSVKTALKEPRYTTWKAREKRTIPRGSNQTIQSNELMPHTTF